VAYCSEFLFHQQRTKDCAEVVGHDVAEERRRSDPNKSYTQIMCLTARESIHNRITVYSTLQQPDGHVYGGPALLPMKKRTNVLISERSD